MPGYDLFSARGQSEMQCIEMKPSNALTLLLKAEMTMEMGAFVLISNEMQCGREFVGVGVGLCGCSRKDVRATDSVWMAKIRV